MTETIQIREKRGLTKKIRGLFSSTGYRESDSELPFAFMLITLMSSCGISPYESFKRLRSIELLPFSKKEASEIVRQVEVLNKDPLTAMLQRADSSESAVYGDALRGYVSSVQSGGSVTSYFRSKLRSIFEVQAEAAVRAIGRLETLVESYMVMLIVFLCAYVLLSVTSSTSMFPSSIQMDLASPEVVNIMLFIVMPAMSFLFMYLAHRSRKSTIMGLGSIYRRTLPTAVLAIILVSLSAIVPEFNAAVGVLGLPLFIAILLIVVSIPSMIGYKRIIGFNLNAENSIPSFLRDVSEARKTGMSPEKSIIQGATRKGYGSFSKILRRIVTQIEWGVSLRRILEDLSKHVLSWPVLTHFTILIETIEVGGGSPEALEQLASYSERMRDIEKNKRDMLKPYVMLPFIWSVLMSFTFTFTSFVMAQIPIYTMIQGSTLVGAVSQMSLLASSLIFQCWLSGFFIGKVI
ncbi:type II secretion system F family protein, partial [Candidatus Bathyarchaeota archaeon]|nr:type II secretion system F family protein [Candidatus Bathyarchaeota archaeon]